MADQKETFGKWLKRRRTEKGLTLRDLEKEVNAKYAYLSQLETGMAKPSEELAKRIAEFFGEDEEKVLFLARDIPKVINDLKAKYPKSVPKYFRKVLKEGGD